MELQSNRLQRNPSACAETQGLGLLSKEAYSVPNLPSSVEKFSGTNSYNASLVKNEEIKQGVKFHFKRKIFNSKELVGLLQEGGLLHCSTPKCQDFITNYCTICEKSYCVKCIDDLLSKNNQCPDCKTKNPVMENVNDISQLRYLLKHLGEGNLEERHIDLAFKCSLCKQLLKDPISCKSCNKSFCKQCFQNKRMTENKCPKCKVMNPKTKKQHKNLLMILDLATTQCKYCWEAQPFNDILHHELECKQEKYLKLRQMNEKRSQFIKKRSTEQFQLRINGEIEKDDHSNTNANNSVIHDVAEPSSISNDFRSYMSSTYQSRVDFAQVQVHYQSRDPNRHRMSITSGPSNMQYNKQEGQNNSTSEGSLQGSEYTNSLSDLQVNTYFGNDQVPDSQGPLIDGHIPNARQSQHRQRNKSDKEKMKKEYKDKNTLKQLFCSFKSFCKCTFNNIDMDNCSSSSWWFYMFLFMIGSCEMFLSCCLFFGIYLLPPTDDRGPPEINEILFVMGMTIECVFWLFSRIILVIFYLRDYAQYKTKCSKITILSFNTLISVLPCEMLMFFGYEGHRQYDQILLNMSWIRRIFSILRILVQMVAIGDLINGDFVTLVFFANFFYFMLLLVALCPHQSSYDQLSWYRQF